MAGEELVDCYWFLSQIKADIIWRGSVKSDLFPPARGLSVVLFYCCCVLVLGQQQQ